MINELRTLLMNVDGSNNPGANYPGEEYVPPTFHAFTLSGAVRLVRQLIFGVNPDRAMLNYRLRELMTILHSGPLAEYVYALDPRVTYWPPANNSLFDNTVSGVQIAAVGTYHPLSILGTNGLVTDGEQLYYNFVIKVTSSSQLTINNVPVTYSTTSGLGGPVTLPGTDISFTFAPVVGASWVLSWVATPSRDLAAVDKTLAQAVASDVKDDLFGANPAEPFLTFRNLYELNPYLPMRVGGITLALGYRMSQQLGQ